MYDSGDRYIDQLEDELEDNSKTMQKMRTALNMARSALITQMELLDFDDEKITSHPIIRSIDEALK